MSRTWEQGSTRAWRRVRAFVLNRDRHRCRLQVAGVCTTRATHAHHTQPRALVGDDPSLIIASCEACNLHVGDPSRHDPPAARPAWLS